MYLFYDMFMKFDFVCINQNSAQINNVTHKMQMKQARKSNNRSEDRNNGRV